MWYFDRKVRKLLAYLINRYGRISLTLVSVAIQRLVFGPHSQMLGQTEVPLWTISYSALINIYGLFIKNVLSESDISRLKIAARKHKRSFTAGEKCRIVMFVLLNYQYQLGKVDIFRLGIL